jgi:hypothetical protein
MNIPWVPDPRRKACRSLRKVYVVTVFIQQTYIYFSFLNLEIIISIIISTFAIEIIEETEKIAVYRLPASTLWCVPGCLQDMVVFLRE